MGKLQGKVAVTHRFAVAAARGDAAAMAALFAEDVAYHRLL